MDPLENCLLGPRGCTLTGSGSYRPCPLLVPLSEIKFVFNPLGTEGLGILAGW